MTERELSESGGRQPVVLSDLTPEQQQRARMRWEHVLEVETGFRGGDPAWAQPGEPRACYDTAATTLRQRRRAKVAELHALGAEEARLLGWAKVSERTLERLAAGLRRDGIVACVDRRWVRRRSGHPSVSPEVREAILAVRAETLHRSTVSMKTREALIHQYVRETFGSEVAIPSYPTLRRV